MKLTYYVIYDIIYQIYNTRKGSINMEKDNSKSKSNLQIQREKMNEELTNFHNSILSGMRKIEERERIESSAKRKLKEYEQTIISTQAILLFTEKKMDFNGNYCIDLSEYDNILKQKGEELKKEQYRDFKEKYLEEIKEKLISQMEEFLNPALKRVNEVLADYTLYIRSIEVKKISSPVYEYNSESYKLEVSFTCTIDIE